MIEISKPKGFKQAETTVVVTTAEEIRAAETTVEVTTAEEITEEEITVEETQIYISENINSTELDLSGRNIDDHIAKQIAPYIKKCTQLEELNLSNNDIGTEGIKAITESISSENLKTLLVNDNYIDDEGLVYIADLVLKQKKLEILDLNRINSDEIGDLITSKGAEILAGSLEQTPALHTLNLASNSIKNDGLKAIIEAINIHNIVKDLNVESNEINDLSEAKEALKNNYSLKIFDLSGNDLGDKGAEIFATILNANNMKPSVLLLINCEIKNNGVKSLASVLEKDTNLKSLYLDSNEISDKGAEHLASMLNTNKALEKVTVTDNQITDKGAKFFIDALKINRSIKSLELDYNKINSEFLENINLSLKTDSKYSVEELMNLAKEIAPNNKRPIDEVDDNNTPEENLNKKIKLEDTSQLSTQVELAGYNPDSDYNTSDLEPE